MRGFAFLVATAIAFTPHLVRGDCDALPIWRDGQRDGSVCRADAAARGLTLVDLGDDWVPPVLALEPPPRYRATYVAIAQERFADVGPDADLARSDRYFELYGIPPALAVVRSRLADDARHACHARVDDSPLANAPERIAEERLGDARQRIALATSLRADLERERQRRKLDDLEALAASDPYFPAHRELRRPFPDRDRHARLPRRARAADPGDGARRPRAPLMQAASLASAMQSDTA